jgi:hypothetical protein
MHIVVADVRFPNEIDLLRKNNGQIWRVKRSHETHDTHVSEDVQALTDVDHVIENDGTIDQLYDKIDALMGISPKERYIHSIPH